MNNKQNTMFRIEESPFSWARLIQSDTKKKGTFEKRNKN